jgi:hypothetical protein
MRYDDFNSYDIIKLLLEDDDENLPRIVKCFVLLLSIYSDPFEARSIKNIQKYIDTNNLYIIWDEMPNAPNIRIENLIYGIATKNPAYFHYCYGFVVGMIVADDACSTVYQFLKPSKAIESDPTRCACFRNILDMEFGKAFLDHHYKIIDETLDTV